MKGSRGGEGRFFLPFFFFFPWRGGGRKKWASCFETGTVGVFLSPPLWGSFLSHLFEMGEGMVEIIIIIIIITA
jgi:hypothetical protein